MYITKPSRIAEQRTCLEIATLLMMSGDPAVVGIITSQLRIDYCDEGLVYSNGDISVTKGGTYTNNTSIKALMFLYLMT